MHLRGDRPRYRKRHQERFGKTSFPTEETQRPLKIPTEHNKPLQVTHCPLFLTTGKQIVCLTHTAAR